MVEGRCAAAPAAEGRRAAASFRDPSGFVFERGEGLFRQVNRSYAGLYDRLMGSGLYEGLTAAGLLVPHEEVVEPAQDPATAYKVLRPERVPFLSYPYEWCFGQLRDAALLTLEVQRRALGVGLTLKDCTGFNVQFRGGKPVFIDTLSFEEYREGEPWVPYRQFCQHFLAPLALMSLTDVRLGQLWRMHIDGVPLDLAAALLPWRSRLKPGLLMHIHLHARSQARHADRTAPAADADGAPARRGRVGFSSRAMLGLLESLEGAVRSVRWEPRGTEWVDYYEDNTYSDAAMERKARIVSGFLDRAAPATVWDLGANTGRFSRLASDRGVPTVAFDVDPACVEVNYREVRRRGEANLLPLCLDLFNPSPAIGWRNRERASLEERAPADAVLALALVHHLTIGGGIPVEMVAAFFAAVGRRLIVEFVPPDDPQARRLLAARMATHGDHDRGRFERAFREYFTIEGCEEVGDGGRALYLMSRGGP
jgi:hypothetical protein